MCYAPGMSPETIAILAVGVALAGLMLRGQYSLDKRVDELRRDLGELRRDLDKRVNELRGDIAGLDARLRSVETGLAELKGQMAMVRDYIMGRNLREPGADE